MTANYKQQYGEWALVLGGSEGLGAAIAGELARRGMNVALVARREAVLQQAARRIEAEFGVETKTIVADMGDPDVVCVLERGLAGAPADFLVYNCAAENAGEFLEQDIDRHLNNLTVNCVAPTRLVHHFGRQMVARRKGGIVICSSLAAAQGIYNWVTYGAAKAYEMIMGEGLWYELRAHDVGATTLMIGSTYTPNFQRLQKLEGSVFAKSRTPKNLPPGIPVPQEPEDAAANLFAQLDKEWLPLIYANPADAERAEQMKSMSRAEMITRMGDAMRTGFRSMADG